MAAAYVRDTGKVNGGGVDTISLSFGTLPAAGNSVIAEITNWNPSQGGNIGASACTDNKSNSYTRDNISPLISDARCAIFSTHNLPSMSGTLTLTMDPNAGSAEYMDAVAIEYSGLATSSTLDKTATNSGTSTNPTSGTTATTSQADELVIAALAVDSGSGNVGINTPSGYTNRMREQNSSTYIGGSCDEKIVAATGTQSADWGTLLITPTAWSACIAAYKAAGGGGGGGSSDAFHLKPEQIALRPLSGVM